MDKETVYYCLLGKAFGFNPVVGMKLIEAVGDVADVFSMDAAYLARLHPLVPLNNEELEKTAQELERLRRKGCYYVTIGQKTYPPLLRECEDAPLGLYVRSDSPPEDVFLGAAPIAIVGTRDISHYGIEWCGKITAGIALAREKPPIVSGLAIGTDIVAHRTALKSGARTVAVMATGIDAVYPSVHNYDASVIAATEGCALVTDYPPGTSPVAFNFLRRNRIIAGMSRAVILVESKERGGGLMTAHLAYTYSRDVYVLPGRIDDLRSGGCNLLLSQRKAEAFCSLDDLLLKLGLHSGRRSFGAAAALAPEKIFRGRLPDEEIERIKTIAKIIYGNRGISTAELCQKSGLEITEINYLLPLMEAENLIYRDLLGNCSIRNTLG